MIKPEQLAGESEASQQKALFCWSALPETRQEFPELKFIFAVPNGGTRNKIEAANLKAQGVKSGVPDICLPVPRGGCHALFIELKVPGGKMNDTQYEYKDFLLSQGYVCEVCIGWNQARNVILSYLRSK